MGRIRKSLAVIIFACTVLGMNVNCYAKANLGSLQNGTFTTLSEADKQDTTTALVGKVARDLGVVGNIRTHYFVWPNSKVAAYSYMNPNDIYINTAIMSNPVYATSEGLTIEQYVVRTIAHEVRHIYQSEHRNDDTEYGRKCSYAFNSYISYNQDVAQYEANFLEKDADAFGADYASKYIRGNKTISKQLIGNDGKVFDPAYYARTYPDVVKVFGTDPQALLKHYNEYGIKERRLPNDKA